MAEFYTTLTTEQMASQIAAMVNRYNRWATKFSARTLMVTPARFFTEIYGSRIVGCASHIRVASTLTKIQYICVLPEFRGRGIAKKLTASAIAHADTDVVIMTIREDNAASLALARSLNFYYVQKHWFRDHWTLTFGRKRSHDRDHRTRAV
jgi:ribosomal protein S18 acetylase RimI-like enzyme